MPISRQPSQRLALALLLVLTLASSLLAFQTGPSRFRLTPRMRMAVNSISAGSMRTNLKFIASDALAGRNTPSPGLDQAAD